MQELIVTIGLPASGKTTWTSNFIQKNPTYINVNRDDIRLMLQGRERYSKFSKWREQIVTNTQMNIAVDAFRAGKSVIVSDTNLNPVYLKEWNILAKSLSTPIKYTEKLFTDIQLGVCLDRDKLREHPVGENVITGMFNKYQSIYWPKPKFNIELPNVVVCDIDGTAAIRGDRGWFEWDKVNLDTVNPSVFNIVKGLSLQGIIIIYLSGRDGVCYNDTKQWLIDNKYPDGELFMRSPNDSRKDFIIKEELLKKHITNHYNIKFFIDDRPQVCNHWRWLGYEVIQIGDPLIDF